MSVTTIHEEAVAQPIRRRRRNIAAELAAARSAWRSQTLAAGLRCDRCGDAASVFLDDRGHCSDCFLLYSLHNVSSMPPHRTIGGRAADSSECDEDYEEQPLDLC